MDYIVARLRLRSPYRTLCALNRARRCPRVCRPCIFSEPFLTAWPGVLRRYPRLVAHLLESAVECDASWTKDDRQLRSFLELAKEWREMVARYAELTRRPTEDQPVTP